MLVSLLDNTPFIGYVMTLPAHKGEGLAQLVTTSSMSSLAEDGHRNIVLYITEGNKPSEALFRERWGRTDSRSIAGAIRGSLCRGAGQIRPRPVSRSSIPSTSRLSEAT